MIHMKSLIRRLDCVPWLLAACALVWAGEATAQIALSLDKYEINERQGKDGASVELTVTAKAAAAAAGDAFVELSLSANAAGRVSVGALDRLKIADTKDSGTLTIKIFPRDNATAEDEITIAVTGRLVTGTGVKAGGYTPSDANDGTGTGDVTTAESSFRLVDDDEASSRIRLTVDTQDLKDESDVMDIKVTATLDGMKIISAGATAADNVDRELKFQLAAVQIASTEPVLGNFLPGEYGHLFDDGFANTLTASSYARRDEHYDITSYNSITIAKDKVSGETTLKIDPKSFPEGTDGPLYIMIGARDANAASLLADAGNIASGSAATDATDLPIVPALIKITKGDVAQVKSIVAIPSGRDADMIREDAGETTVQLLVTLENAAGDDGQPVAVKLNDLSGKRDEDFQVRLGPSLKVEAGKTTGIVEVYVTPEDDGNKDNAQFEVIASIPGRSRDEKKATITIVDDDKDTKNISLTGVVQVDGRDNIEIYEKDGPVTIEVTATVDGVPLGTDAVISLTLAPGGDAGSGPGSATRDVDYELESRTLVIPAGESLARTEVTIIPEDDGKAEDPETIILGDQNAKAGKADDPTADLDPAVAVGELTITLKDGADPDAPAEEVEEDVEEAVFALVDEETDIMGTVGEALSKQLPAATGSAVGEDADVTYLLNSGTLPDGLAFDGDARTISGTPSAATEEAVEVTYYATDGTNIATLDYSISIAAAPAPQFTLEGISSSHTLLRENAGHATTITLNVTLAEAAESDTKVTLDFAGPREGDMATRDEEFTASWDADLGRVVSIAKGSTSGMAKVSVMPTNNSRVGSTAFTVQATSASGSQAKTDDIVIADDESSSSAIVLSVDPDTITETDGETSVIVTATLSGGGLDEDTTVTVGIAEDESSATRDSDYSASFASGATRITIAAGDLNGQTSVSITPTPDADAEEGEETIVLTGMASGLATGSAQITLNDGEAMTEEDMDDDMADDGEEGMDDDEEDMMMMGLHFAEEVGDQAYTAGAAIADMVLPEAMGGEGDVTYQIFGLPAGLSFDAATRTISGTPEAAGSSEILYLATDSSGEDEALEFTITVNAALSFGDLFGAAGKANPASEHGDADFSVVVGQELILPLPAVTGGTPPLTYSVAGLPAGLSFDPETRIVSGVPEAVTDTPVAVTYIVTDGNGATIKLPILVAVIPPPLAAPPNLLYEIYSGADGQGTQGGFVLLTWELSEHHAGIDGYRIYRELPVLGNEMVPWAFADAVPEVAVGRAIVAMLDGVQTSWGITAERGGQTTPIVSGNQAGKRVPMSAGLNADARMYLDTRTALPSVGEDLILDVRMADFVAVKGYGLQLQYDASKLEFVELRTDQPLEGRVTPQVLADEAGVLTVAAYGYGDVVPEGEVALSLVFRPTTEIENTIVEIIDSQTYDSEVGFSRLALPAPVQLQTRPSAFALANNYPNPFNPATTIKYALPQAADVELTVYNVVGQPVRTLVAEHQSAGRYVVEWDATNDSGHNLSSGMYFYRLEAGGDFHVKKMLLLK